MPRLSSISFVFPGSDLAAHELVACLAQLLAGLATGAGGEVRIVAKFPAGALPCLIFTLADVDSPEIYLDMATPIEIDCGGFYMGNQVRTTAPSNVPARGQPALAAHTLPRPTLSYLVVAQRFGGHILALDHGGVEFPADRMGGSRWNGLLRSLSSVANVYAYPTGEAFPFILPATAEEFAGEITDFAQPRQPKFELTHGYVAVPTLQLHFDTDLPRPKVEARLPAPMGFALGGSESSRSVYVSHPWPDLMIRWDFSFRDDAGALTEWNSGKWIAQEGKRLGGKHEYTKA